MGVCRDERQAQALALRWSGEQIEGARQALAAARSALQELKAIERKRQQKVHLPSSQHCHEEMSSCCCCIDEVCVLMTASAWNQRFSAAIKGMQAPAECPTKLYSPRGRS